MPRLNRVGSAAAAVPAAATAARAQEEVGSNGWIQDRLAGLDCLLGDMVSVLADILLADFDFLELELSDIDDDPAFWREDRLKRLGLEES